MGEPASRERPSTERRLKRAAIWVGLVGVVGLIGFLALAEFRARGTSGLSGIAIADFRAQAQPETGVAPEFDLPAVDGTGSVSLSSYRGDIVALNFWATWCTPCWREAPGLQRTFARYRSRGVRFVGINERDDLYAARSFIEQNHITFPSGSDPGGRLAFGYEITGMPTTFLIDADGQLVYRFLGYLDERTLDPALDAMLEGQS